MRQDLYLGHHGDGTAVQYDGAAVVIPATLRPTRAPWIESQEHLDRTSA